MSIVEPPQEIELPMICTCRDEGRATAQALMEEVIERLSGGSDELASRQVSMDNFLTCIVQSLNWDYDAHVTSIDNDQWSAVTVEKHDGSLRIRVECDRVENGLAAAWKTLADGPSGRTT